MLIIMKRKTRCFRVKYLFTDKFFLIPILILILLLGTPGLNAGVQASDSILGPNFNEYRESRFGFASFQNNLQNFNPDLFEFDLKGDELLLNILDPTKPLNDVQSDPNVVEWDLFTNDWNVNIQFESIGKDNDDCGDLTDNYVNEFFKYTVTDGDSGVFENRVFKPGESTSFSGIENDILDGTIKVEYDPGFSDKRWCAVRAGKYCDIILITISGDYEGLMPLFYGSGQVNPGQNWVRIAILNSDGSLAQGLSTDPEDWKINSIELEIDREIIGDFAIIEVEENPPGANWNYGFTVGGVDWGGAGVGNIKSIDIEYMGETLQPYTN